MHRKALASALAAAVLAGNAAAQTLPVPQNVVSLNANASIEVAKDWLTIVFSTTRDGADAGAVQTQLKTALDTALAEARKLARPGQVEVQTGNFSLSPRYAPKGGINGWQGTVELIVEGKDIPGIAQLSGRITTLSIQRVGFSLSREAREKVEADVAAQAIVRFRARADAVAKQFGFAGYSVREVSVGTDAPMSPAPMLRMQMNQVAADAPLPTEAGKATVTTTVSGSVQLK